MRMPGEPGKKRVRIIDGEAYMMVDDSFAAQGKYREHIVFWRHMDGRTWALMSDSVRLTSQQRD